MTDSEKLDLLLKEIGNLNVGMSSIQNEMTSVQNEVSSMKNEMTSVQNEVSSMKNEMTSVQNEMSSMKNEMTSIKKEMATKSDLARTEKRLNDRITTTEEILLDEIERVHNILDKHVQNTNKHTA